MPIKNDEMKLKHFKDQEQSILNFLNNNYLDMKTFLEYGSLNDSLTVEIYQLLNKEGEASLKELRSISKKEKLILFELFSHKDEIIEIKDKEELIKLNILKAKETLI